MTFRKGNKAGRNWGKNTVLQSRKDPLQEMADTYLTRMSKGQLEPGEQGAAAVVLGDRIRRLEAVVKGRA